MSPARAWGRLWTPIIVAVPRCVARSRKGRYYVEHTSQWQPSRPHVEWVSREAATQWLLHNDHELPADLADLADEVSE